MEEKPFSDISYELFLDEEKLMGSRCKGCGTQYVPPRSICVDCYKSDMEWVAMKGKGRLAAFSCINIPPLPSSQVVRTVPRGETIPDITLANVPPILDRPADEDRITILKRKGKVILNIPE